MPFSFCELESQFREIASHGSTESAPARIADLEAKAARRVRELADAGKPAFKKLIPAPGVRVHRGKPHERFKLCDSQVWDCVRLRIAGNAREADIKTTDGLSGADCTIAIPKALRDRLPSDSAIVGGRKIESDHHNVDARFAVAGFDPAAWRDRARDDAETCKILAELAGEAVARRGKQKSTTKRTRENIGKAPKPLTDKQKAVLKLRDENHMTFEEIGRQTRTGKSAAKELYDRAKLREAEFDKHVRSVRAQALPGGDAAPRGQGAKRSGTAVREQY